MNIYFIGINGAGISALAHFALDVGYKVSGSDLNHGANMAQLEARGAHCSVGDDTNNIAHAHGNSPIDWVVVSSAVPDTSPELQFARENDIKLSKRTDFINTLCQKKELKIIAIAGTHGKTTVSAMAAWALRELGKPASHVIGTNLSFANSGAYVQGSQYLLLEADEYDRMMLAFHPNIALITSIDYDHPDIYPTREEYMQAFRTFLGQSNSSWLWLNDAQALEVGREENIFALESPKLDSQDLPLPGEHNRANAELVATSLSQELDIDFGELIAVLATFPGTARRFEQIGANLFSDYGHTPAEISATLQLAREGAEENQRIVVVYQPHQNTRQHLVKEQYAHTFDGADAVYWLPTFLSREDHDQQVLKPEDLVKYIDNSDIAAPADMDDDLAKTIKDHQDEGDMVILFGAGSIDDWARSHLL